MKQYRQSLSRRITFTFLLLMFGIASVFSFGVTHTIYYTERHLVLLDLGRDIDGIVAAEKKGQPIPQASDRQFFQSDKNGTQLPNWLKNNPVGFSEHYDHHNWYHIVRKDDDDHRYLIVQKQNDFEHRERRIHRIVFGCWLLSMALAFFSARLLVRRAILPVRRLATQVSDVKSGHPYTALAPEYSQDEVGTLATAFDDTFSQMHRLLEREREFTGAVSHELRSPLMVEQGALELLSMTELTTRQQALVERMERAHKQMGELVSAFLLLARERKSELSNVPTATLREVAQMQLDYWKETAQHRKIDVQINELEKDDTLYPAPLLHSVLGNLLRNAVHYSLPGKITVNIGEKYFDIIDHAPSIQPEKLDALFTPFVRGTNEGNGLGLGLAIVNRICQFLGWDIHHQTIDGVNSFTIRLNPVDFKP